MNIACIVVYFWFSVSIFFFSLLMKACNLACKNEEALKTVMEIVARVVHLVISGDEPIWNCLCDIEEYVNLLSAN